MGTRNLEENKKMWQSWKLEADMYADSCRKNTYCTHTKTRPAHARASERVCVGGGAITHVHDFTLFEILCWTKKNTIINVTDTK